MNGGNVTAQSQLITWLFESGRKLDGVSSTCNGINCEIGCPDVIISDEATECIKE